MLITQVQLFLPVLLAILIAAPVLAAIVALSVIVLTRRATHPYLPRLPSTRPAKSLLPATTARTDAQRLRHIEGEGHR